MSDITEPNEEGFVQQISEESHMEDSSEVEVIVEELTDTPSLDDAVKTAESDKLEATLPVNKAESKKIDDGAPQDPRFTAEAESSSATKKPEHPLKDFAHKTEDHQMLVASHAKHSKPHHASGHMSRHKKHGLFLMFGASVLGALATCAILWSSGFIKPASLGVSLDSPVQNITVQGEDATLAQAVAKKALPSVVSINSQTPSGYGVGSGVILDSEGHIITNYHVVAKAERLSVTIENKVFEGEVIGSDPSSDLAVVSVKLDGAKVTPIAIGDSAALNVGDWVMSIGSPFGLDQSVSTGIVSSLYRNTMLPSMSGATIYSNLIQTDAAMNPGNSGGALVNSKGELVGINSIIKSNSGNSAGVGFAIPGNYAVDIANTIIAGNKPVHPYLGVHLYTITPEVARMNHLLVNQGAYVQSVIDNSPAKEAGLKQGDIIIAFGKTPITSADALILQVRSHVIGEEVEIAFVRDGKEQSTTLKLGSDENLQNVRDKNNNGLDFRRFFGNQDDSELFD